ncbi:MAG: hypothetical protein NXH75_12210 [Halobacteriovoraceae bacterium]|nr:hypothetical protein [Halobacteriovoraceae bacterium]
MNLYKIFSIKRTISFLLIFIGFNGFASECSEFEKSVWSGTGTNGNEIRICWNSRYYSVLKEGEEKEIYPAIALAPQESLVVFLKNAVGESEAKRFESIHQSLLQEYLGGVEERATESMTGSVVGLMDIINQRKLLGGIDCDPSKMFLSFDVGKESQMRCIIHSNSLPREISSKMKSRSPGTGHLPLKTLLGDFPEAEVLLRSKVHTKEDGSPREINPRDGVPIESFLLYDLILKLPEGEYSAVGRCYDWNETMFNYSAFDSESPTRDSFYLSDEEENPFAARLNDSWRIPFGVDLEEREIRKDNGEKVPAVDIGVNSSLMYREDYSRGRSFEFGPTISHPFMEGLSGPGDALNINNLNLDYRKTTIGIGGMIKF